MLDALSESELLAPDAPTQDDLPCDDGIPMETHKHKLQMDMLVDVLITWLVLEQGHGFVGGNMFVYFSPTQVRNQDYRGPDVFVVLDVPVGDRKSWVVWQEGKGPDVVIELLSESTAEQDKTTKKRIYQNQLRVPEYFWYDPFNPDDFAGFSLEHGAYRSLPMTEQGSIISQQLNLALVKWQGVFKGIEGLWLRWATLEGELLPTDKELVDRERQNAEQERQNADRERQNAEQERQNADRERQNAEQERQKAEQERQKAARLAERLRELGVDPDQI